MIIGVPKEIKNHEYRVALTPSNAKILIELGHKVLIEASAGINAGFEDGEYAKVGAVIINEKSKIWGESDLIVKVKEPIREEYGLLREGQKLFTYLHLAASKECTKAIIDSKVDAFSYETLEINGKLPLLAPMSEIAGKLAGQIAAHYLLRPNGGSGKLIGGVPGVKPAKSLVIGGGIVGIGAARVLHGMGAEVTVFDINEEKLSNIRDLFKGEVKTIFSSEENIQEELGSSDIIVGGVLIPGRKAPKIIGERDLKLIKERSVLVDVAIDQGGCFEGSKPTTHEEPTFLHAGKLYYCVANMPGSVPVTSTLSLTNKTIQYIKLLASGSTDEVIARHPEFLTSLNVKSGEIVNKEVKDSYL